MNEQLPPAGPPSGPPPAGPPSGPPPAGPPSGPPPAARAPSTGAPSGGFRLSRNQLLALGGVLVLALGVGAGLLLSGGGSSDKGEVFLEPVNSAHHAFTPSVGTDVSAVTAPTTTAPAATTGAAAGIPVVSGDTAGLYGGTLNAASCDPTRLVDFLEQNPAKAAAWASVVGIRPSEIRSYVATLTPVILRSDTRVTNHGWVNGRANAIPAVLQAGTAVLVDQYGQPVAKCYCGNPLSPPEPLSTPVYTGRRWPQFSPTTITVINQSTTVINVFVLVNPQTGEQFGRPAGTTGASDGPVPPSSGPATTTTTRPRTTTTRPPGKLVDGTYTLSTTSGTYPGCGEVTGGSAPMTVQGDTLVITDPDNGTTYSGTVERTGGTFRMSGGEGGVTFVLEGRIDDTGHVTGTITYSGASVTCQVPVTGQRG